MIGLPQPVPPTRREFPVRRRSVRVVRWGPVQVVVAGCIGNGSSSASDPDGWNQFAYEPIAEKVGRAWTRGSTDAGAVSDPIEVQACSDSPRRLGTVGCKDEVWPKLLRTNALAFWWNPHDENCRPPRLRCVRPLLEAPDA